MRTKIIKNFDNLSSTDLRRDLLEIAEAGYEAIDIRGMYDRHIELRGEHLVVDRHRFDLSKYRNIYLVGVGKGSGLAAQAMARILKSRITKGYAIDIKSRLASKIRIYAGTHPLPSEKNITATNKIIELLKSADKQDLIISVICGGGSSLFCQPAGLSCVDLQHVSSYLLKAGATIQEINTVRKHLSLIHGGYFAQYAYPATVLGLIISDVPGDDLNYVASGPTVLDKTTQADAEKIAHKYHLKGLKFTETPKDPKYFERVTNVMLGNGSQVVEAMATKARELGYKPRTYSKKLAGLAKDIGPAMAESVKPGEALLACGESQVVVSHPGKGGRNQDLVLAAAPHLKPATAIASCASDGKDNVPVAGAVIDNPTGVKQLHEKRIDPSHAVAMNSGFDALKSIDAHLQIRKTTANISDFVVVIQKASA